MVTALYGVLDPSDGSWVYSVAGHCPVVLRSASGGAVLDVCRPDPPLGLGRAYQVHRRVIAPGTTLLLYTDGLLERRDESIDVGFERLTAACAAGPDDPVALCAFLMREFLGDAGNDDDAAVVAVRRS
jgi:serine phosphatase RsbU (regulator of sigma subunit)